MKHIGILCMANIEFNCPKCKKVYSDENDIYLNRCNRNSNLCTKIKCACGQSFYMTYNYTGDAVSFLISKKPYIDIQKCENNLN